MTTLFWVLIFWGPFGSQYSLAFSGFQYFGAFFRDQYSWPYFRSHFSGAQNIETNKGFFLYSGAFLVSIFWGLFWVSIFWGPFWGLNILGLFGSQYSGSAFCEDFQGWLNRVSRLVGQFVKSSRDPTNTRDNIS